MARRKRKNKNIKNLLIVLLIIILGIVSKSGYDILNGDENVNVNITDDTVKVHFIDVGQGSSTLLQSGKKGILVDAGESEYGAKVAKYIQSQGIKELEYVVVSHPHSDHAGGIVNVLNSVSCKNIVMPEIADKYQPTTKSYYNLIKKIDEKNINYIEPKYGDKISIDNINVNLLAPVRQDENLNNMSIICKVTARGTSFLLPGDAEKPEISSILGKSPNLKCDVMAMSHHGSATAYNKTYLDSAGFSVAVISCGKDNTYGHPHKEIMNYLTKNSKKILRTDQKGTIVFECTQKGYTIKTEK